MKDEPKPKKSADAVAETQTVGSRTGMPQIASTIEKTNIDTETMMFARSADTALAAVAPHGLHNSAVRHMNTGRTSPPERYNPTAPIAQAVRTPDTRPAAPPSATPYENNT